MLICPYCQKPLKDINEGSYSTSGQCYPCHAWYLFEDNELTIIEIKHPTIKYASCWIRLPDNQICIETETWEIKIPLTWIFPQNIDDIINRYANLKVFF